MMPYSFQNILQAILSRKIKYSIFLLDALAGLSRKKKIRKNIPYSKKRKLAFPANSSMDIGQQSIDDKCITVQ